MSVKVAQAGSNVKVVPDEHLCLQKISINMQIYFITFCDGGNHFGCPIEVVIGMVLMLTGGPLYWWFQQQRKAEDEIG
jgi:hypothetical protein